MKKIIYLILCSSCLLFTECTQSQTNPNIYIYRNYSDSIIRVPYPSYVVKDNYIYRLYPKSIIRVPYPEFTIKGDNIYRTYPKSIIRTPYPIGKIGNGIPE